MKLRFEPVIIFFVIMLLFGLAVRADIETDIRFRESVIVGLERRIGGKVHQIVGLQKLVQKQMQSPEYAQPVDEIIISSLTGIRVNPLGSNPLGGNVEDLHEGVDLVGEKGTPVRALLSGRVVLHWLPPGWYGKKYYGGHSVFGGYIVIDHGDELFSKYGHLSKTFVHEGGWIEQGQIIGEMGSTGKSTGSHLHLEIVVNPLKYLSERRN